MSEQWETILIDSDTEEESTTAVAAPRVDCMACRHNWQDSTYSLVPHHEECHESTVERMTMRSAEQLDRVRALAQEQASIAAETLARTRREHETFKDEVLRVAHKYAAYQEWCGVADEAMDEIGLADRFNPRGVEVTIQLTITGTVRASRAARASFDDSLSLHFLRDSLQSGDEILRAMRSYGATFMDSDYDEDRTDWEVADIRVTTATDCQGNTRTLDQDGNER